METVLYDISYVNIIMFCAATPRYDDEKEEEWDDSLDANNPDNFNNGNKKEYIR